MIYFFCLGKTSVVQPREIICYYWGCWHPRCMFAFGTSLKQLFLCAEILYWLLHATTDVSCCVLNFEFSLLMQMFLLLQTQLNLLLEKLRSTVSKYSCRFSAFCFPFPFICLSVQKIDVQWFITKLIINAKLDFPISWSLLQHECSVIPLNCSSC